MKTILFTAEQLEKMNKLIRIGRFSDLTSIISNISPEQEAEIQKLVDENAPKTTGFESKILKGVDTSTIKSPEQEAELQEKLEAEWNDWVAKHGESKKVVAEEPVKEEPAKEEPAAAKPAATKPAKGTNKIKNSK